MRHLPVEPAWRLAERAPELRWLVTQLWSQDAVGIVGGEPKCCKSFLALDLAVAVAAGVPCLRRFTVPDPGRVLLYAAEDAHPIVRRRLEGIAVAAGVDLRNLDIQVITAPTLRLDLPADRVALQEACQAAAEALDPRSLRAPAPDRRERQRRGCPTTGLSPGAAAPLCPCRPRRPSCQEGRRQRPCRPGAARILGVPRLGRQQPLSAARP